jgi:hypothetical protein
MSAHMANAHLLEKQGRQLTTKIGTPVCFGQGYNGTGPAGQAVAATTEYMYATGRVMIWGTEAEVPPIGETMDRALNQIYTVAEKIYAVAIECGVWAIQVTRDCTTD